MAHWEADLDVRVVPAVVLGGVAVLAVPTLERRLGFRTYLALWWGISGAFAVFLAATRGRPAIAAPLDSGFEYRAVLDEMEAAGVRRFVETFTERLADYPTHVRGHPVGAPLVFWLLERVGLRGGEAAAAVSILVGTSVVVSVGVVVRQLVDEASARRAVPFVALFPGLVWVATSADALFGGVVAASVALFSTAAVGRGPARDVVAIVAGAFGALALHLSYGAVVMLAPAAVVVLVRRCVRPLLVGCVGAVAVTALFTLAGFWWFAGLGATRVEYVAGAGGYRPFWYFATLGNPAAFMIALGPAVVVALVRCRDRRVWTVVGGALLGVVVANVSGMSKAEVERIWLPFVPWLAASTAIFLERRLAQWWLAAQVGCAVALELVLESPW